MADQLVSLIALNKALDNFVAACRCGGRDAFKAVYLRRIQDGEGNYSFTVERKTWLSRLRIAILGLCIPGYRSSYDLRENRNLMQESISTLENPDQHIFELVAKINSIIRFFNETEKNPSKRISYLEIDPRVRGKASVVTPTVRDLFPTLDR